MNSKRGKAGQSTKCESPAPLIPHIKIQDNQKVLPKYATALNRSPDEILPAEDLDAIQLELEHLLCTVALRYRVLKSEIDLLEKSDDIKDKRSRYTPKESSPNKKRKFDDRNRVREGSGKLFSSHKNQLTMKVKNSGVSSSPAPSSSHEDSMDAVPHMNQGSSQRSSQESSNKLLLPRNDIPNKFWLSVEPYCMPITQEDINLLDDLIEEYTGTVLPPIPELGPHYGQRWAMDDLKAEFDLSSAGSPPKPGGQGATSKRNMENGHSGPTTTNSSKKNEKALGDGVLGPLTQRLVSALMEENLVNAGNNDHSSSAADLMMHHVQPLIKNGIVIEKRLKKELIEQGILDSEDLKEEDDEILTEIKRVRAELAAIGEYNANELRKLHSAAVEEMKRLEVKRQLDAKDQEIIEYHRKLQITRQKHRPLTKQEKEDIYRLCEEQRQLSELLDSFAPPGPHYATD